MYLVDKNYLESPLLIVQLKKLTRKKRQLCHVVWFFFLKLQISNVVVATFNQEVQVKTKFLFANHIRIDSSHGIAK